MRNVILNKTNFAILVMKLAFLVLLTSCSKGGNDSPMVEEASISIVATRINTAPRSPSLGTNQNRMCMGNNKIYTFDRDNAKFMSYDIAANTWTTLSHDKELQFAGYGGLMIYLPSHEILYFNGSVNRYATVDNSLVSSRNKWTTKMMDEPFRSGESGYAVRGKEIYSLAGRVNGNDASNDVRKYNISTGQWQKVGNIGAILDDANALMVDKKIYLIGERSNQTFGAIFDTEQLTHYPWALPEGESRIPSNSSRHMMVLYKEHLFVINSTNGFWVYSIKNQKWIGSKITVDGDFIDGYANIFTAGDKVYVAGRKNGNFALYTLKITFP